MIFYLGILLLASLSQQHSYNPEMATDYWYYTAIAQCQQNRIEKWDCGTMCERASSFQDLQVFHNSTGDNAGFIGYQPERDQITILLRGTLPWGVKNYFQDLDFVKVKYSYCQNQCQVHRGFYHAFVNLQDQMFELYQTFAQKYSNSKLVLVGHSLGGAMALHARVFFWSKNINVDEIYTFGCPRVGDKQFATWFKEQVHPEFKARVTHGQDPVVHQPAMAFGFQHVNTEIYYDHSENTYQVCNDDIAEDKNCSNKNLISLDFGDHNSYMEFDTQISIFRCNSLIE